MLWSPLTPYAERAVSGSEKVTTLFISHALPKGLKIDEVLQIGKDGVQQLKAVDHRGALTA